MTAVRQGHCRAVWALFGISLLAFATVAHADDAVDSASQQRYAPNPVTSYMRFDGDRDGVLLQLGAQRWLSPGFAWGADAVLEHTTGLLRTGPLLRPAASLMFFPTIGASANFTDQRPAFLEGRLLSVFEFAMLYVESRVRVRLAKIVRDNGVDLFYTRNFLLFAANSIIAFGPQMELSYVLNRARGDALQSLPVGGRVNLSAGQGGVLGMFLGREVHGRKGWAGRFTFLYRF